ncbi:hypothetical protein T31B1_02710 [Salinisphaera sp. T31B1]
MQRNASKRLQLNKQCHGAFAGIRRGVVTDGDTVDTGRASVDGDDILEAHWKTPVNRRILRGSSCILV